jgi:hypothetical protein
MIDREAAADKTTETRAEHLSRLSGLPVRGYRNGKLRWFVFGPPDQTVKTIYTYRKARTFAEGVATGRIRAEMAEPKKPSPLVQAALALAGGGILAAAALTALFAPQFDVPMVFLALAIAVAVMIFGK